MRSIPLVVLLQLYIGSTGVHMGHILAHLDLFGLFRTPGIQSGSGLTGSCRLLLMLLVLLGRTLLLCFWAGFSAGF